MSATAHFPAPTSGWSLATLDGPEGPLPVVETGGRAWPLAPLLARAGHPAAPGLFDLFADWPRAEATIAAAVGGLDPAEALPEGHGRLSPLLYPGKVLCAGANYYRHLAEMGVADLRKEAQRLFFFFKPSRNAVVGPGETVHMPLDTKAFDWEVELAAVIGRRARAVRVEDALDHVAAFTVAIDFSARDLNMAPETFYKLDWVAGKAQETCCPMGPRLVPASALAEPGALGLRLSVNGEMKQDDTTEDMIFSIAEQISIASRIMTLDPGDVILTGTPAGVGAPRKTFLSIGDRVTASAEGIGALDVVIAPPRT